MALAAALGSVAGCASPGPEGPRPTPIPAQRPALEAESVPPEPGVEVPAVRDRAAFDVRHYDLAVDLRHPHSGAFDATATIRGEVAAGADRIRLDFVGLDIRSVELDGSAIGFERRGGVLTIGPFDPAPAARARELRIVYGGEPADGLFFGQDARGEPAVFADNWPNRARWWFPSNDHPSDKATARFLVTVPSDFAVIGNGALAEIRPTASGVATWVWETSPTAPIPSYTMVIGVARFDRRPLGPAACGLAPAVEAEGGGEACVDVSIWALVGDGDYGAERFSRAPDMLQFYAELIGPYPYEKLAHVESSTRFGGMENSSAIFYGRGGWEERRMGEGVIAHETAHQWFGDAVSPGSWYHLWVSEGFASYFGPLYFEARDGEARFRELMTESRNAVVSSNVIGQAIVDSSTNQLFDLLNSNNYPKGAWVLHMLRHRLGDETFFEGIGDYYRRHLHGTATTGDVRRAFERVSGQDLGAFFAQWVDAPGHPRLHIEWAAAGEDLDVSVAQTQPADWPSFELELELAIEGGRRAGERITVRMSSREERVRIAGAGDATGLVFDPDVSLLATAEIRRRP